MTELDRYDWAITLVAGVIMVGALMLGAPIWIAMPILMATISISLYRHTPEIRPLRIRRRGGRST
jgi:hypothetical protein